MPLRGCLRCVQWTVFLLNFVVWISGMTLLIAGIFLRMDININHTMVASYADNIVVFHWMCYTLIGTGVIVTFIGFLGCCSAFQESRCMLGTFFAVLVLLISAEVFAGVWSFQHVDEARLAVAATFTDHIKSKYGTNAHASEPVDHVQRLLHCCGGAGPADWFDSSWANTVSGHAKRDAHHYPVPDSCCFDQPHNSTHKAPAAVAPPSHAISSPRCLSKHRNVQNVGCARELNSWLDGQILNVFIAAISLTALQLFSLCLSLALCCGLRRQSAGGYKT